MEPSVDCLIRDRQRAGAFDGQQPGKVSLDFTRSKVTE